MATISPKRELAFLRDECRRQQEIIDRANAERGIAFIQGVSAALHAAFTHENGISFLNSVAGILGYGSAKSVAKAAGDVAFLGFIQDQECSLGGKERE